MDLAVPDPGVMAAGEKEQLKVDGRSEHESEIELLNDPDCGFAVSVTVPDFPPGMLTIVGVAVKDRVEAPLDPPHEGV